MNGTQARGQPGLVSAARPVRIVQRVLLGIVGGYFLAAEAMGLLGWMLTHLVARSEAAALAAMLAFVTYLCLILWAFGDRSLKRLWLVIPGTAGACFLLNLAIAAEGS